jgi:hypothetical protein
VVSVWGASCASYRLGFDQLVNMLWKEILEQLTSIHKIKDKNMHNMLEQNDRRVKANK